MNKISKAFSIICFFASILFLVTFMFCGTFDYLNAGLLLLILAQINGASSCGSGCCESK
jgi:hypothetical protein